VTSGLQYAASAQSYDFGLPTYASSIDRIDEEMRNDNDLDTRLVVGGLLVLGVSYR
jgi:hypothetical protein